MEKLISKYTKNEGKVDYAATKKLIEEIDLLAETKKQAILNYESEISISGKTYYVSQNGNDNNDGLSPATAWKTIQKVNNSPISCGDAVLFERGGIYRGMVMCDSYVTYSAYGDGPKPVITCSPENGAGKEKWSLLEGTGNIWVYYKELPETGLIVFNDGEDYSIKKVPSYINGKFMVRHKPDEEFDVRKHMHLNLTHFNEHKALNENGTPDIAPENLCPLYLRCDKGNPGEIYNSIEFAIRDHGFRVPGARNVTIDNVAIKYVGGHGVAAGTCRGLTVKNCEFGWIGGGVQYYRGMDGTPRQGQITRYGNAIEIYGGCYDYTCDNNYIYQVFDAGVTHQFSSGSPGDCKHINVHYTNNLIEYCTYSIEYFLGQNKDSDSLRFQRDIYIENNILRYSGFGFGEQRPEYDCPAAHIKGWDSFSALDENSFVRNNIFDRGRNMIIHVGTSQKHWLPIYNNNIFIQYLGETTSTLGRYGKNPTTLTPYTENIREVMTEMNLDANAGIYFAERDELYDLPDFMPYKD